MEDEQASNNQHEVMTMESSSVFIEKENCNKLMESLESVVGYKGLKLKPHFPENSVMEGELDFEDEVDGKVEEDTTKENMNEDFQNESFVSKHFKEKEDISEEENQMSGKEDGQLSPEKDESKEGSVEEGEDDGELSDDDLEEGEVKDSLPAAKQQVRQVCRFFNRGQCTWGNLCRFLHLSVNDRGNYNMFAPSNKSAVSYTPHSSALPMGPVAIPVHVSQRSASRNISEYHPIPVSPSSSLPNEATPVESAWERGLRHAKEMVKKASRRKEQEPDFEEKRMNLGMEECHKGISSEYDKENDYYVCGKTSYRRQNDAVLFSKFEQTPNPYDKCEDEAKEHWHGGQFENFEIRWLKSGGSKGHREKELARNSKFSAEREKQLQGNKWRDERLSEIQTTRSRADEWRDPWRRSKTPKGRRSRSRIRSRGSYSSVSSHSYSERSSHSSYSYSRSSSRSSFYSSRRSSSSRSVTRTPSRSRSRSRCRSYSRSLTMDSVSSASSSISRSSSRSDSAQNRRSDSVQNQNVDSTLKKRVSVTSLMPRFDIKPSEEEMVITEIQALRGYERMQGRQKKKTSSLNAMPASSQSSSFLNNVKVHDKEQVVIKQEPGLKPHVTPAIERPVKEQPKIPFLNKPIKLTLLNKGPSPKFSHVFRREPEFRMHEITDEVPKAAIKRPLSPGKDKAVSNERKSASSRRDELLKQLKAVEDAIARKRAKFF